MSDPIMFGSLPQKFASSWRFYSLWNHSVQIELTSVWCWKKKLKPRSCVIYRRLLVCGFLITFLVYRETVSESLGTWKWLLLRTSRNESKCHKQKRNSNFYLLVNSLQKFGKLNEHWAFRVDILRLPKQFCAQLFLVLFSGWSQDKILVHCGKFGKQKIRTSLILLPRNKHLTFLVHIDQSDIIFLIIFQNVHTCVFLYNSERPPWCWVSIVPFCCCIVFHVFFNQLSIVNHFFSIPEDDAILNEFLSISVSFSLG